LEKAPAFILMQEQDNTNNELRQGRNAATVEIGNNSPTKAFRQTESSPRFCGNDRSYAVLLSKQRHRDASLWIGEGVVENRDRSNQPPINFHLRCAEPDLAFFMRQQIFNGSSDKP